MATDGGEATIRSVDDVRRHLATLLRRVNDDEQLALRAAANPLLALEEMGYQIADEVRPLLARRARHSAADAERLEALERRVHEFAGERFDLDAPDVLARVLFEQLKLPRPSVAQPLAVPRAGVRAPPPAPPPSPAAVPYHLPGRPHRPDPLEPLRGAHPVMEPLLEYRAIEARQAPLAPPAVYERLTRDLAAGDAAPLGLRLRVRFRRRDEEETPGGDAGALGGGDPGGAGGRA